MLQEWEKAIFVKRVGENHHYHKKAIVTTRVGESHSYLVLQGWEKASHDNGGRKLYKGRRKRGEATQGWGSLSVHCVVVGYV